MRVIKLSNESARHDHLDKNENRQYLFIALFFYAVVFTDTIRLLSTITGISAIRNSAEFFRNIIYAAIFIGYYYNAHKMERTKGIIVAFFYLLISLLSILLNPNLQVFLLTLSLMFVSRFLLAFVMISSLEYPQQLIRKVFYLSWMIPIYVLIYAISPKNLSSGYAYSITFSYNLLLPAIAAFYCFYVLKEKRIYALIVGLTALGGMLVYGSRGTMVCLAVGAIYILFYKRKNYSTRRFITILVLSIISFTILIEKDSILSTLTYLLPNSRSLYFIQNSNFFWASNRNHYFEMAGKFLQNTPLKITGLAGDVFVYGNQLGIDVELGIHSHNMFVELMVSYGAFLGGLVCVYIVYRIIASVIRAKRNSALNDLCAFLIVPLLPYILISGSLCQSYQHWLMLGGLFSILNKRSRTYNGQKRHKKYRCIPYDRNNENEKFIFVDKVEN